MWWIVVTFGVVHHVSLRQRAHGCECVSVDECISNGVDVAPFCDCMDISGEDYVICYTTGTCAGAFPSTVYAGATFRPCDYFPPPPPHPNACNDPLFTSQWHLDRIHAPDAWSYATGGTLSSIAIVDDGLQYTHGDLNVDVERSFGWNSSTGMRLSTAHAHDAPVPTRFSAEIARCAATPWAPGLAEQRLSVGASGTGGERRQQDVERGGVGHPAHWPGPGGGHHDEQQSD